MLGFLLTWRFDSQARGFWSFRKYPLFSWCFDAVCASESAREAYLWSLYTLTAASFVHLQTTSQPLPSFSCVDTPVFGYFWVLVWVSAKLKVSCKESKNKGSHRASAGSGLRNRTAFLVSICPYCKLIFKTSLGLLSTY